MRYNKKIQVSIFTFICLFHLIGFSFADGEEVIWESYELVNRDVSPISLELCILHVLVEKLSGTVPCEIELAIEFIGTQVLDVEENSLKLFRSNSDVLDSRATLLSENKSFDQVTKDCVFPSFLLEDIDDKKHLYVTYETTRNVVINNIIDVRVDIEKSTKNGIWINKDNPSDKYLNSSGIHKIKVYILDIGVTPKIAGHPFNITVKPVDSWWSRENPDLLGTITVSGNLIGNSENAPKTAPDGNKSLDPPISQEITINDVNGDQIVINDIELFAAQNHVQINISDGTWSIDSNEFAVIANKEKPKDFAIATIQNVYVGKDFSVILKLFDEFKNPIDESVGDLPESVRDITITVTGGEGGNPGTSPYPDKKEPYYPYDYYSNRWDTNPVHVTTNTLTEGIKLYAYESNRQLRITLNNVPDNPSGISKVTNFFDVVPDPRGPSELVITGYPETPKTVDAGEAFDITVTAYDQHRNIYRGYNKLIRFMSSDKKAVLPPVSSMPEGTKTFPKGVTFYTANRKHSLMVEETESLFTPLFYESTAINVLPLSDIIRFDISTPPRVIAGEPFNLLITSYDPYDNVSGSSGEIEIKLKQGKFKLLSGASIQAPSLYQQSEAMQLMNGMWSGGVVVSGEALTNSFIVSIGGVTYQQAAPFIQTVPYVEKDMNYPNPFSSVRESTTIRYYLPADGHVDIRIYTLTGDVVREWGIDGNQGINLLDWDGKDGNGNTVGSGGYLCAIWKKGFRSIWSNGLNHKPIIVKIAIIN